VRREEVKGAYGITVQQNQLKFRLFRIHFEYHLQQYFDFYHLYQLKIKDKGRNKIGKKGIRKKSVLFI
jgi:hypothetical protein